MCGKAVIRKSQGRTTANQNTDNEQMVSSDDSTGEPPSVSDGPYVADSEPLSSGDDALDGLSVADQEEVSFVTTLAAEESPQKKPRRNPSRLRKQIGTTTNINDHKSNKSTETQSQKKKRPVAPSTTSFKNHKHTTKVYERLGTALCSVEDATGKEITIDMPWMTHSAIIGVSSSHLGELMDSHISFLQKTEQDNKSFSDSIAILLDNIDKIAKDSFLNGFDNTEKTHDEPNKTPFLMFESVMAYIDSLRDSMFTTMKSMQKCGMQPEWWSLPFPEFLRAFLGDKIMNRKKREAQEDRAKLIHAAMVRCKELKEVLQPLLSSILSDVIKVTIRRITTHQSLLTHP